MKYKYYFFSILGLAALLNSCGSNDQQIVKESIRPVKYGTVIKTGNALTETFSGTAQSSKDAKVSFKVGGTINALYIKVGDQVRKGQRLARIDQTDYNVQFQQSVANLAAVESQIKSANTQLINSKAAYERVEKLYENNSVSLSEFEQAKSAYEVAQSSYDAALAQANASEKQVESAQNQVNYSTLTAPFTGIITSVNVEENEQVAPGNPIAMISATGNPEISVGVPEVFISKIKSGQSVQVTFSSLNDVSFTGKIYEVGYSSLGGSTYPVTVRIDQPTADIRPGMAADVQFDFSNKSSSNIERLVAPVAAVGEDTNGHFVFLLKEDGNHQIATKSTIQIGELTAQGFEIISGLSEGDLVATAGLNTLLDGMKVGLMEQN